MSLINDSSILSQLETLISSLTVSTEESGRLLFLLKTAQNARSPSSSIVTELLSRIDTITTTDTIDELVLLVKAAQLIEPDKMISVPAIADLTAFTDAIVGTVLFVQEENAPYIRKSDGSWVLIDPTLQPNPLENAWAWGAGLFGMKGDNTASTRSSPASIAGGFTDWVQVSAGYRYGLGVRSNGTLWAWGYASGGKLGNGAASNRSSPVSVVGGFVDWIQTSAGSGVGNLGHSLGLRANGTLYAWGSNSSGQLGLNVSTAGLGRSSPELVAGGFTDWIQASAGAAHSLGVRANGTLYAWGNGAGGGLGNGNGRLGDNSIVPKSSPVLVAGGFTDWIQASAGVYSSLGIRATGQLYSWGSNSNGGLGQNTTASTSSPVLVVGGFTDWIQAAAGKNLNNHNFALRGNGILYGWGAPTNGVLGTNTAVNRSSPASVVGGFTDWVQVETGAAHTLAVRANGVLYAWGTNTSGALGDNATAVNPSSPVSVIGGFTDWVQASAGNSTNSLGIRGG